MSSRDKMSVDTGKVVYENSKRMLIAVRLGKEIVVCAYLANA